MANAICVLSRQYRQLTAVLSVSRKFIRTFHKHYFINNFLPVQILTENVHRFAFDKRRPLLNSTFSRNFSATADGVSPKKRKVPKLILLQNPFKWLMIKVDFSVLKNIWDPTFQEKEFKFGTKQAIARVTQVISEGRLDELNGLLTKAARKSLLRDLERNWTPLKRTLLALDNTDIQISAPRRVYFIKIADKKYCDVDMVFLALKWMPVNSIDSLIFSEIFARFHREYTPHCIPEWTIAYLKVTRLEIIRK